MYGLVPSFVLLLAIAAVCMYRIVKTDAVSTHLGFLVATGGMVFVGFLSDFGLCTIPRQMEEIVPTPSGAPVWLVEYISDTRRACEGPFSISFAVPSA